MANVLRRLGFKKHEPRDSDARQKLQKELFAFSQCAEHGFPHKPSALAYDPKLKLLAIGSRNGDIRVFGRPGVEYSSGHKGEAEVTRIFFLPEQARLVSLCNDNSLHLWEINTKDGEAVLQEVRSFAMEASKLKSITACCLTANAEQLFIGTEGGNIHILNLPDFKPSENIIYQDVVMQNVPDDFKVNPGPVEAIAQHPSKPEKFLIGYNRGLMVLWDNSESQAVSTFNAAQQLESVGWHRDGTQFMSAHADGSHIVWSTLDPTKPKEQATTPYGPFPCKAINKIQWKTAKSEPFILFSGGMPRASYGDRHTVSVMQGSAHSVFDFSSKVLDFVTICSADELEDYDKFDYDDPHSLLVLTEEEIVTIDLQSEDWPAFKLPYLNSLHSSAITCVSHVTNVPDSLWNKITDAGEQQFNDYSSRDWPITGGQTLPQAVASKDLLLTGHEDGSIRFWDVSTVAQRLIYSLKTGAIFGADVGATENAEDEEWPPFKKVGTFDPYSDDPRLGIQKINLCPLSETLVVAGTAGQVVILQFEREEHAIEVKSTTINIVSDRDGFVWKGHEALPVQGGEMKFAPGFQPLCVMQASPPAACTALTLQSEIQLIAMGTAHGVAVFDYNQRVEVTTKCTLNPADLTGTADSAMSRRKSFKKSLRESFRRLRRGRSGRKQKPQASPKQSPKASPKKSAEEKSEGIEVKSEEQKTEEGAAAASEGAAADAPAAAETVESTKPVERAVEARTEKSATEDMASMVRCLYFADTFLINAQNHAPTLWVGTNGGTVFIYQITIPASDKRDAEPIKCQLGKEVQLKHRAPVINISVVDSNWQPLPAPLEVQHERAKAPDMSGGHHVVICSEEQFKVFDLPSLKAKTHKYKLTATEGAKVRRVGFVNFRSRSDERYHENDLAILTNQGDVQVFTVPSFKRQLKAECVRKENVSGIVSSVFTLLGEGFYLLSPSEFQRFSVSARIATKPACEILLKDGVRPPLPEPETKEEAVEEPFVEVAAPEQEAGAAAASGEDADKAGGEEAAGVKAPAQEEAKAEEPQQESEEAKDEEGQSDDQAKPAEVSAADTAPMDQSALTEAANDSMAVADTTGDITVDSVRVHLSESRVEESSSSSTTQVISERSMMTRTVVSKTVVSETSGDGTVTKESTTVTQMTSGSSSGPTIEFGEGDASAASGGGDGAGDNLDDDSKLTGSQVADEIIEESSEALEELHISEDEAQNVIAPVQSPVCTPVDTSVDTPVAPVSDLTIDNDNTPTETVQPEVSSSLESPPDFPENNQVIEGFEISNKEPESEKSHEIIEEELVQVTRRQDSFVPETEKPLLSEFTAIDQQAPPLDVSQGHVTPEEVDDPKNAESSQADENTDLKEATDQEQQPTGMEKLASELVSEAFSSINFNLPSLELKENDDQLEVVSEGLIEPVVAKDRTESSLTSGDLFNKLDEDEEDQEVVQKITEYQQTSEDQQEKQLHDVGNQEEVEEDTPSSQVDDMGPSQFTTSEKIPDITDEPLQERAMNNIEQNKALTQMEDQGPNQCFTDEQTTGGAEEPPPEGVVDDMEQNNALGQVEDVGPNQFITGEQTPGISEQPLQDTDVDGTMEQGKSLNKVVELEPSQVVTNEENLRAESTKEDGEIVVEADDVSDNVKESQWISEEDLVAQPGHVTPPEEERKPILDFGGEAMIPSIEISSDEVEGVYYTESGEVHVRNGNGGTSNLDSIPEITSTEEAKDLRQQSDECSEVTPEVGSEDTSSSQQEVSPDMIKDSTNEATSEKHQSQENQKPNQETEESEGSSDKAASSQNQQKQEETVSIVTGEEPQA